MNGVPFFKIFVCKYLHHKNPVRAYVITGFHKYKLNSTIRLHSNSSNIITINMLAKSTATKAVSVTI
jgi:hypothetical protein